MSPRSVLITGATKGIGRACAGAFARAGYQVTAVARTATDLEQMAQTWQEVYPEAPLQPIVADLATPEGVAAVPVGDYDVVVLNAGAFAPGRLLDEADTFSALLDLNVLGNHRLARRVVPALVKRGAGHLGVIGSTGTDNWKGHMTAYVATKYALRGLFLGWQADLLRTCVRATLIAPAATLTASWENETPPPNILSPDTVAEEVLRVVKNGTTGRVVIEREEG